MDEIDRNELVSILAILADLPYQQEIWREGRSPKNGREDFDIAMHFLLDDTVLAENPTAEVGHILKNEAEAEIVGKVTQPLLALFKEIGGTHPPHVYVNHPKWLAIVEAAKKAYAVLKPA